MHDGWPSAALPKLLAHSSSTPVTNNEGSWLAMMPLLGAPLGCLSAGYLVDVVGRKPFILMTSPLYFAAWLAIAFARNFEWLCVARFAAGIGIGWIFATVPIYICEICESSIRGFLGAYIAVSYNAGILLATTVGSYLSIKNSALVSTAVPVLAFVSFVKFPESPYYYLLRKRSKMAEETLQKLNRRHELASISTIKDPTGVTGKLLDLFRIKHNRRASLITLLFRVVQQMGGTGSLMFYVQIIFKEVRHVSPETYSIVLFAVQLIVTIIASCLVDRVGRRPLLICSTAGGGVCILALGVYFTVDQFSLVNVTNLYAVPVVLLIAYTFVTSLGLQPIPMLMVAEIFPPHLRGLAVGMGDIYYCLLWGASTKTFQATMDSYGICVPFYIFCVVLFAGAICIWKYVPETKGKSLEQIDKEMTG
ncbi:facilitated trehalose transporter Tret1-like isoform X2 [Cylas formicarius]|nr:facilitated trehalose transporter Tret1-like isoform X2 [Cylas formicarius]